MDEVEGVQWMMTGTVTTWPDGFVIRATGESGENVVIGPFKGGHVWESEKYPCPMCGEKGPHTKYKEEA